MLESESGQQPDQWLILNEGPKFRCDAWWSGRNASEIMIDRKETKI